MKRAVIGIVIAQVVLYMFGFLYWGMGPYPTLIWKQAHNPEATAAALKEQFPDNGTYFVPSTAGDPTAVEKEMVAGPVAFVHMLDVDGRPAVDPKIMATGFVFNLITIVLIAILLRQCSSALPTYFDRVKFVSLAGFVAAFFIDGGEVAWWMMPVNWKIYQAIYNILFWVIAGLILALFVESKAKIRQ